MSYGFGVVGEGVGAWTQGVRRNQEAEARNEERRINKLYTRYQLAAARRQDAEQAYQEHATAVGEGAAGSRQEAEVYNSRDEERKMRESLYDTLSGKKAQPKGKPKGLKGLLYRALDMDETQKPTEQGYDTPPSGKGRYPMDERLPDGRTVTEATMGKAPGFRIGSMQEPMPTAPGTRYSLSQQRGPIEPGNVDLAKQPKVRNADGSISTVDSSSYNIDGAEVLLPSVTTDGRHLSTPDEIVAEFKRTGRHLGKFRTPQEANAYAEQLHRDYASGKYDQPTTPAETAPGTAPEIKSKLLSAMANPDLVPTSEAAQIPQEVEENRGQFAPEGRVQAGLSYQFPGTVAPRSGSEIRSNLARKIPMATPQTMDAATKLAVQREADNIIQNLEGYVDHVKRTKREDDDSYEHAQKDASFNKYLGALKSLEAGGFLKPNTVDEFLDKSFHDSPARMRSRPVPTQLQEAEDKMVRSIMSQIGQPDGPKNQEEAMQRIIAAKSVPRSNSARALLEARTIDEMQNSINPKTGKKFTSREILNSLPRPSIGIDADSGPMGSIFQGLDTEGNPIFWRGPQPGKQPGTDTAVIPGVTPKEPVVKRNELLMDAPRFTKNKEGKDVFNPNYGRKVLSAVAIMDIFDNNPTDKNWEFVNRYYDNPLQFEEKEQWELLGKLIRERTTLRPRKKAAEVSPPTNIQIQ